MDSVKKWVKEFWFSQGERLSYSLLATIFGVAFIYSGNEKLASSGETIIIGVGMYMFKRITSTTNNETK